MRHTHPLKGNLQGHVFAASAPRDVSATNQFQMLCAFQERIAILLSGQGKGEKESNVSAKGLCFLPAALCWVNGWLE